MRPLLPVAALLLALGHGGAAAAAAGAPTAEAEVPLRWQAPPECPRIDAIEGRIEALLGGPFAVHGVEAEALVERSPDGGWSLALTTRRGPLEERRTLEARECETLANALSLVLAVLADPVAVGVALAADAGEAGAEPVRRPSPPPPPPPPSRVNEAPEPRATSAEPDASPLPGAPVELTVDDAPLESGLEADVGGAPAEPFTWSLRLAGGAEFGALPSASGGLAGAIGARRGRGGIELGGLYVFPRTAAIPSLSGASVWSRLWTAALRGCGSPLQGDLEIPLCAGLELGALEGEGRGLLAPERQRRLWVALVAAPSLRWSFSEAVALWVGGELAVPLVAPTYVVDLTGSTADLVAHRASPVTGRVLVGFEVRLSPARDRSRAERP